MNSPVKNKKVNRAESVRQKLKNLSITRNRPFDEILRYYAIERFLYRLSVSKHNQKFLLKGGLMLKVWDATEHRATMDIDLLAKTSNKIENLKHIIKEVARIKCEEDAVFFDTSKLIIRRAQTAGEYDGFRCSFSAGLFTTKIPILIDIGFNDTVIPSPEKIEYPTLLQMSAPILLGYNHETVFAEKFESIVKLATVNTRMKDFYDLWTMIRAHDLDLACLKQAVHDVFLNRETSLKMPASFNPSFYQNPETQKRWKRFLETIDKEEISLDEVIPYLSDFSERFIDK